MNIVKSTFERRSKDEAEAEVKDNLKVRADADDDSRNVTITGPGHGSSHTNKQFLVSPDCVKALSWPALVSVFNLS